MKLHELSRDFVGRCVVEQDAFGVLRELCEGVGERLSGSDAEARATELVRSRLAASGCETAVEPFSYAGWRPGPASLVVESATGCRRIACLPLGWSPAAEVRASVVDVGCGMRDDWPPERVRGKIALVSSETPAGRPFMHRSEKYAHAAAAGAAGFVFYDRRPGGLCAMGSIDLEGRLGKIPAVGISYEDALALRRADGAVAAVGTASSGAQVTSHNGIGLKRGSGAGEVVVCGHMDSWFSPGAVDNGTGVAMVAELARLLAPYPLERSVRFVTFGSEELGLLGSKAHVRGRSDLDAIACVVNLDCSAVREGTLGATTNESPSLHAFVAAIAAALRVEVRMNAGLLCYSDHYPFRERGVPGVAYMSGGSSYGYGHTSCDTLDKVSPEAFTIPMLVAGVTVIECAVSGVSFRGGKGVVG